ncbi:MAG: NAD(P)H-dependent oxidoreductase subunit E [Thermoleophilaceae bacterium]
MPDQPERMQVAGDEAAVRSAPVPAGWDEAVRLEDDPATVPDPAEVEVPDELRRRIEERMAMYPDRHSAALPALGAAQELHGWCSPQAIRQVAAVMQVTPAYLSSVATFYDMLRTEPRGRRYVYVCTSVACHLRNAKAVYDAIEEQAREQGLKGVEIREFECLGACDMAPMASIDGRYVGPLSEEDAGELVSAMRQSRKVLPGRGLVDPDFRLPWDERAQAAQSAGPQAESPDERAAGQSPAGDSGAPPAHPDVSPPGGTVKDRDEEGLGQ